jgi:hypothetical protein
VQFKWPATRWVLWSVLASACLADAALAAPTPAPGASATVAASPAAAPTPAPAATPAPGGASKPAPSAEPSGGKPESGKKKKKKKPSSAAMSAAGGSGTPRPKPTPPPAPGDSVRGGTPPGGPAHDAPPPDDRTLSELNHTFFVGIDTSDGAQTMMAIGVANEIRKAMKPLLGAGPWIVPEPSWRGPEIVSQCNSDPQAIGGVILTYYTGFASHFYLLYQSETTTFQMTAEVIACNRTGGNVAPTMVGVIAELPGAKGTPWIVRRSQVSIPLISAAAATSLFTVSRATTDTNLTYAAIIGSLFSQASTRDIPGYSEPLRLRYGSQHIGVDLVRAMRDMCTTHADLNAPSNAQPRDDLCTALGFTLDPAKVKEQQDALDAFELKERTSP